MSVNIKKTKLVGTSLEEVTIVNLNGEDHMKIPFTGISYGNYVSKQTNYSRKIGTDLYLPLWIIPYVMATQRKAVVKHEQRQLNELNRLKQAYNTEVK